MNRRSIILLLFLPFLISIFAFVTSTFVIRSVEMDIEGISWSYSSGENPFSLSDGRVKLEATPIYDERYPLSEGNELVWSCHDSQDHTAESSVAHIDTESDGSYLVFDDEGSCLVTCSNEKGNYQRSFTARIVGDFGAIIVNPADPFSSTSISNRRYVGLYDSVEAYENDQADATMDFDLEIFGTDSFREDEIQVDSTDNVEVNLDRKTISITGVGDASITFHNPVSSKGDGTLNFTVVPAVNVYDYDTLMDCTNRSETGVPLVLRKNLLPQSRIDGSEDSESALFGPIEASDLYTFQTTYDHSYLDLWNQKHPDNIASLDRYAAIHIQSDFYGNGFEINLHDLCYPSEEQTITDSEGNTTTNAILGDGDLYRGPLILESLGDPNTRGVKITDNGLPIFALYGQDNVGFYVDGDDITLEDCHFANADSFSGNLTNLTYTGTVLETRGDGITIRDSIIENGRNVVRAFSCDDLTLDNCLLQNGMEFLFLTGSNTSNAVDHSKEVEYTDGNGVKHVTTAGDYLSSEGLENIAETDYKADTLLSAGAIYNTQANEFIGIEKSSYTKEDLIEGLNPIRDSLTNTEGFYDEEGNKIYDGNTTIVDCSFDNSGISAIGLDTLPQGSFLETNITSLLSAITGMYFGDTLPSNMARTSAPVLVDLEGDCRFYDWKSMDDLSFESLILENIAALIEAHGGLGDDWKVEVTEDDYLPLKLLLSRDHSDIIHDGEINFPIFYRGGGYNGSDVIIGSGLEDMFGDQFSIDPYVYSLDLSQDPVKDFNSSPTAKYQAMKIAMLRAASNVTGFYPYRFQALSSTQFQNESPDLEDFQSRA